MKEEEEEEHFTRFTEQKNKLEYSEERLASLTAELIKLSAQVEEDKVLRTQLQEQLEQQKHQTPMETTTSVPTEDEDQGPSQGESVSAEKAAELANLRAEVPLSEHVPVGVME